MSGEALFERFPRESEAWLPTADSKLGAQAIRLLPHCLVDVSRANELPPVGHGVRLAECKSHEGLGHCLYQSWVEEAVCMTSSEATLCLR